MTIFNRTNRLCLPKPPPGSPLAPLRPLRTPAPGGKKKMLPSRADQARWRVTLNDLWSPS